MKSSAVRTGVAAVLALTFAACGGGGGGGSADGSLPPQNNPGPVVTPTPTAAPQTASKTSGIAYVPGNGNTFPDPYALTVVQYEDSAGALLRTPVVSRFGAGLGANQLVSNADGSQGVGIVFASATSLDADSIQALGLDGNIASLGNPLNVRSVVGTPISVALLPDNDTVLVQGSSTGGFAGFSGAKTGSLNTAGTISYNTGGSDPQIIAIAVSPDGHTFVARGNSATYIYNISAANNSYNFQLTATDTLLDGPIAGRGAFAFDPAVPSHALFGYLSNGDDVTVVTGLPDAPTHGNTLRLGGNTVNSIAITADGNYGLIGTKGGIFVVTGVNSGSIALVSQSAFSLAFTDPFGGAQTTADVVSVGLSSDGRYAAALATYKDSGGQMHEALEVVPFNNGTFGSGEIAVADLKAHGSILGVDDTLFR